MCTSSIDNRKTTEPIYKPQMNYFPQNWIFIHRIEFLSTPTYFCPQNHTKLPPDRVRTIPGRQRVSSMHLQASGELFSTESNFYPQSSIFIHISYNSYPQVRNLIQVFTNQISVQTVIIVGDWKILSMKCGCWGSMKQSWDFHVFVFSLNFMIFSSSKTWIFINKLRAL